MDSLEAEQLLGVIHGSMTNICFHRGIVEKHNIYYSTTFMPRTLASDSHIML